MTDRRASIRRRSPHSVTSPINTVDLDAQVQSASAISHRRPVRAKTATDESSPSIWVDVKDDARTTKGGRATPRKDSKKSPSNTSPEPSPAEQEKDSIGFFPKLSRILEGREGKTIRRRRGSTIGSREDAASTRRRHRPVEDATLSRRSVRQKHGSLQRRVENIISFPNTSLVSVLSGLTQVSGASSGSNSTITQQSYDRSYEARRKRSKLRDRTQGCRVMDRQQASVLHYGNQELNAEDIRGGQQHSRPSTASSASSVESDSTDNDGRSSLAGEADMESPLTSPASLRRPAYATSRDDGDDDDDDSGSEISVREATPDLAHQASVSDDGEESEHCQRVNGEEEESSEEEHDDSEGGIAADGTVKHAHHMALEKMPPPRLPSSSASHHSDRHSRRLRRQEQALNEHVLQSPQPHRGFQFVGGQSPYASHAMPLYSPYVQSGASPINLHATAHNALPAAPPPPQMVYYSPHPMPPVPYSPGYEGPSAMVNRPPMAAPSTAVPQPSLHYPTVHPTQYQHHLSGPDLSRSTLAGYELLANKLSEGSKDMQHSSVEENVVPMYRKFEHLNHRVLLHIQDEIAELEDELRYLDECVAQYSPRNGAGRHHPASRRSEMRYGSELHGRRTELLGRIYLKLGQYNTALSSFSNMLRDMAPAELEDIDGYKTWMENHTPIDHVESRFLERKDDLLRISRRRSASIAGGAASHQPATIWLPMILVLPLMAFAIVPGLLGRLFILCVTGAATMRMFTSTEELQELMTMREWTACLSVYFGLMALLGAVVH